MGDEASAGACLEQLRRRIESCERDAEKAEARERELIQERRKLTTLLQDADAAFAVFDDAERCIWANDRFDDGDPRGRACRETVCRKPSPCADCPVRAAQADGEAHVRERRVWSGDRYRDLWLRALPIKGDDGEVRQTMLMVQDLSDLEVVRRSAEAQRASDRRFQAFFEGVSSPMVTLKLDGAILRPNSAFCTMLGLKRSELMDRPLLDLVVEDDREDAGLHLLDIPHWDRNVVELEMRLRRCDGTTVWSRASAVLQFDERDRPAYALALLQNITRRKETEDALARWQGSFETLVQSIDSIVWEADPETHAFRFVSRRAEEILGFEPEAWISQPRFWRNRIHPDDVDRVVAAYREAVEAGRSLEIEYRMVTADGREVTLRDRCNPVVEGGTVVGLRGILTDVTERHRAREALKRRDEQVRVAQRMEAIGRLAGGVAKEFNNLMTTVAGYADLIRRGLGKSHPLCREANEILAATERASELTGQLLTFGQEDEPQRRLVSVDRQLAEMGDLVGRVIRENVELIVETAGGNAHVAVDPSQFQQVVLNLVTNACDAMPDGGTLRLETATVDLAEGEVPGLAAGPYVELVVRDDGCGMDGHTRAHMFEPFFTTKDPASSPGLGLSTVYGIVARCGGHVRVESGPREGTAIRVVLPCAAEDAFESLCAEEIPELAQGIETILLVEDNAPVRALARQILQSGGYTVVEAGNGVEALSICERDGDRIDLMATDLIMPSMGGRELAVRVAEFLPELRVLYFSAYKDGEGVDRGLLDAGAAFLQKPFTPASLCASIRATLDRDRDRDQG